MAFAQVYQLTTGIVSIWFIDSGKIVCTLNKNIFMTVWLS